MNEEIINYPEGWDPADSIIKVIGVGGGGCNAVTYMYNQKIKGCNFIVCNTDSQALQRSNVPVKIQLGPGLGAGTDPIKGRNAALDSQEIIEEKIAGTGTKMLFITAGMGGGTGTGASPVIAEIAKKHGILTVAVVTLPFENEGDEAITKAIDGIHELQQYVDSLLLINNEKLYEFFGDQLIQDAFPKADEVLATAVAGITEIISKPGYINVDFEDVKTMMRSSGMALMGCGTGTGKDRIKDAVEGAFHSPLLNDFDLKTAKNVLINITAGNNENGLKMNDLNKINDMINQYTGNANKFKRGLIWDDDPAVGDTVKITAIATGFNMGSLDSITHGRQGNLIIIDSDFTYQHTSEDGGGEAHLADEFVVNKINPGTAENHRRFSFGPDDVPVLVVKPGESISELERTPAFRRFRKIKN